MKKVALLMSVCFWGCGSTGSAGSAGSAGTDGKNGINGKDGSNGQNGSNGKDGQNGNDNHIVKSVYCSGTVTDSTGFWTGVSITYQADVTSYGDVLANAQVGGLSQFNNSSSSIYAKDQTGASTGDVFVHVDNSNYFTVGYDSATNNVVVSVTSTNGHSATFPNNNACTVETHS